MRRIFQSSLSCIIAAVAMLSAVMVEAPASAAPAVRKAAAEANVKGKVVDKESGEPAGWATVALMTADSTIVAGTTCAEDGTFAMTAVPGTYTLSADLIGYVTSSRVIILKEGENEIGSILLDVDAEVLAAAKLTERVNLVEMKIDKVVMNISQSAFSQGSDALELMKKAPGVTIDKDGNVMLNGKKVSVWIDGRPSHLDGKALEALLRSTNSESIDKFEIMEHPSAKYDAEGQGGIINIKTKRNLLQGFNGSMGLGGGAMYFDELPMVPWRESYWLNLAYRTKKTNTFFSIYEGFYNTPMRVINETILESLNFRQMGTSYMNNFHHNYNVKVGTDWFIDDRNTFGVIAYLPGSYTTFNSLSSTTQQFISDVQTSEGVAKTANGPSYNNQQNLNLNYTHVFDEARAAEITTNLDYFHNISDEYSSQEDTTRFFAIPSSGTPASLALTMKDMSKLSTYDIYSAKADYQSVVWKMFMLEAGAKWALSVTDNNSVERLNYMVSDESLFQYREDVAAAYASLAGQLSAKWSFKAGLRGEYTHSFGDWMSSGDQTNRSYFDVFPTVYLGFAPSENWRYALSYSRRINRPQYWQLNPTKVYVDSKTYTVGNPDILPQYSNSLFLTTGYGQHLSLNLGYHGARNGIEQIPTFLPDGTEYLTWGNAMTENLFVADFSIAALPLTKWLQWTLNIDGMSLHTMSTLSNIKHDSMCASMYTVFEFLLPGDWKIDWDAICSTPLEYGFYRIHSSFMSDFAAKKTLLDGRMTLTIKLDDVFRTYSTDIDIYDETGSGAYSLLQQKYYSQRLVFDITWNFGKAQKPVKQRNVGNLEEMSRATGGGGGGISAGK